MNVTTHEKVTMLFVLSPAKTLDYESRPTVEVGKHPSFMAESSALVELLKTYSPEELSILMSISAPLAQLNVARYKTWSLNPNPADVRAAVCAFNGEAYEAMSVATMSQNGLEYLEDKLRILSGLYGVLLPSNALQPYRLEMGIRLKNSKGANLYAFWRELIAPMLRQELMSHEHRVLVNLASDEYFKAIDKKLLDTPVITPVFEDEKAGSYKVISFYAKRARGLMMRYASENQIEDPHGLKDFTSNGYRYIPELSTTSTWLYRRKEQ